MKHDNFTPAAPAVREALTKDLPNIDETGQDYESARQRAEHIINGPMTDLGMHGSASFKKLVTVDDQPVNAPYGTGDL